MRHPLSAIPLLAIALTALSAASGVRAAQRVEPVCIVTGLTGKAQTQTERGITEVALFTEFAPGARTRLDPRPVLRWREPERGLRYEIVVEDDEGATLVARSVSGGSFELPAELTLAPGAWYLWTISARSASGTAYRSLHRFRLADASTAAAAVNFQPSEDAARAERVAYAAWLESAGLRDAAAAQWAAIVRGGGQTPPARSALAAER